MEAIQRKLLSLSGDRNPDPDSYTRRLLGDADLLRSKLIEEARELGEAGSDTVHEAADLAYFLTVTLMKRGVSWEEVVRELETRNHRVRRRGGDAKPMTDVLEVKS